MMASSCRADNVWIVVVQASWLGCFPSRRGLQDAHARALSGLETYERLPRGEAGA
jgi:hypothetical protein